MVKSKKVKIIKSKRTKRTKTQTTLIVPQNMYFIIRKFNQHYLKKISNKNNYDSKRNEIIKSKLGLNINQYWNLLQASDTGSWKNFNDWYKEVCCGDLVNQKIGKTLSTKNVYNSTLRLIKFGKKYNYC